MNAPDSCYQIEIPFEFLDVRNHPTPTDLERNISKELVEVFLQTCTPIERVLFGRDKPLKGPGSLWINPADRLSSNQVRLTPSKTECVQALTHLGILEIGKRLEEKVDEKNRKIIAEAVAEIEEFAKFKADKRIKFHIATETEKLNEEWEKRVDRIKLQHEDEKKSLMKLNEEARNLFQEFLAKKCEHEKEILLKQTVAETKAEMEKNCVEQVNEELMQQSIDFDEKLENTLKNLEAIDKDRMNTLRNHCLDSMDLQANLMTCRQLTEMMHMMVTIEKRWRMKMTDMKNDFENPAKDSCDHQSKSLKQLWIEFQHQLCSFDGKMLGGDEKEIFDKILQIRGELMIEPSSDRSTDCFIIQEPLAFRHDAMSEELMKDEQNVDWIEKRESEVGFRMERAPYVNVKWENDDIGSPTVDSFMSSVFNRFLEPQRSMHRQATEIASSIMELVKKSIDDEQLKENIATIVRDLLEGFAGNKFSPDASVVVPMPKTEAVSIKDSMEVLARRVPHRDEPCESSKLLSVVDSLEKLMTQTTLRSDSSKTSCLSLETKCVNVSDKPSRAIPSYSRNQKKSSCNAFERMTEADWNKLKRAQQMGTEARASRLSSVRFDESHSTANSKCSNNSSILKERKQATIEKKPEIDDALRPIRQKCQDVLGDMTLETVLKKLCEDS